MRNIYPTILLVALLSSSCSNDTNGQDKRKEIIRETIAAVSKYDTVRLFRLIDTAYYFDTWSKEIFLSKVSFLKEKIEECGGEISDTLISVQEGEIHTKKYILSFCRGKKDEILNNSFDLVFIFADYETDNKIMTFNIKNYLKTDSLLPTKPAELPIE